MQVHANKCECCFCIVAVPFFVLTRPKGACIATLQCIFCKVHSTTLQSRPLAASPCVLNADLVVPCLQARSLSIGGTPSTPSAESPTFGVASLSAPNSPMISSSVASHNSDVLDCLMEVSCVAAPSGACKTMAMHQMSSVSTCLMHTILKPVEVFHVLNMRSMETQ